MPLRFDEWWELYDVEPIAPEITVWNKSVGYAGTLDLVARINGRICLIDYKTKGTTRDGTVKPLDDKVVMQLVAGMKAEESLVDAVAGSWEPWKYGETPSCWRWPSARPKSVRCGPTPRSLSTTGGSSAPCGGSGSCPRHAAAPAAHCCPSPPSGPHGLAALAEPAASPGERLSLRLNWIGSRTAHREERQHMAILNIRIIGDPVLRTVADPVTEFGPELAKLVADMTETMEDVEGAGLAAPQVGVSLRVFTYRIDGVDGHVVNPVLENSDDFQADQVEGCLSIPGLGFPVRRSAPPGHRR